MNEESKFLENEKLRLEGSAKIQREIISLKNLFHKIFESISIPDERIDFIEGKKANIVSRINELLNYVVQLGEPDELIKSEIYDFVNLQKDNLKKIKTFSLLNQFINDFDEELNKVLNSVLKSFQIVQLKNFQDASNEYIKTLDNQVKHYSALIDDQKNIKVHKIFEDDSEKFKSLALKYEIAFYAALAFLFLYFLGWYVEIDTATLKFKLAEQFHGNHTPTFYVQKISLLILSTTLAAFLLKRSFMNRRLADEAYRTSKELDALPRYMEGMPDEMKEKIRFDLAYKYFGNGIHHESYTSGENLMHENIKANTDFIKAVKDLSAVKAEKPQEDKAEKGTAS